MTSCLCKLQQDGKRMYIFLPEIDVKTTRSGHAYIRKEQHERQQCEISPYTNVEEAGISKYMEIAYSIWLFLQIMNRDALHAPVEARRGTFPL